MPVLSHVACAAEAKIFRAGAAAVDITPQKFPVSILGGFLEEIATQVTDPLHARCVVLDDGDTRLAIAVVDSCMMPRELLDEVKEKAREKTGLPTDRMLISATHSHSAPAAMGCLGTPTDAEYVKFLPDKIVESIVLAAKNLAPAKVGWTVVDDWDHTYCRRWIFRPDKMGVDPFGGRTMRANMHPGYQNPDAIGPAGPVDPGLSILSIQSHDGRPLALLANYSMHYYGAKAVSADYYGRFAEKIKKLIGADTPGSSFVGIMSQGTSGDQMWMDYGQPEKNIGLDAYAEEVARAAHEAYKKIEYRDWVPLAMAETKLTLRRRVPDEKRLAWAKEIIAKMTSPKPRTIPEVYALEVNYLHDEPVRELKLQALRIGDLGIAAIPDEVFGITGLKLKAQSPLQPTFNIELANGAEGYIPPPEQHKLGGYTTWPARTAALEEQAEPKIVETLLGLLEKVSGKPRRNVGEENGPYAKAVMASSPQLYLRFSEFSGPKAFAAAGNNRLCLFEGGIAYYLSGPQSPAFSGGNTINPCAHFAGGRLLAETGGLGKTYSVELWFWNGLPTNVRDVTGFLISRSETFSECGSLGLGGTNGSAGKLFFATASGDPKITLTGTTEIQSKTWNHVVLVRDEGRVRVHLNGNTKPEISGELQQVHWFNVGGIFIGGNCNRFENFEGKIDEVAIYKRALSPHEVAEHFKVSGMISPTAKSTK